MRVDEQAPIVDGRRDEAGGKKSPSHGSVPGKTPGFGRLSRRVITWSGNLLATCVIVILSLTFGKQVIHWWHGDSAWNAPAPPPAAHLGGLADPTLPHLLAFGDLPFVFERTVFEGTEDAALARLREKCQSMAVESDPEDGAALPVSRRVLRRLGACEPVEQGEGWRIVQQSGPVISVVMLRTSVPSMGKVPEEATEISESVVSWGLGLRAPATAADVASRDRWTLFTCSGRRRALASDADLLLPTPPDSRRTLAIQVENGGAVIGFVSRESSSSSKQFFDELFARRGWQRQSGWTRVGRSWHARFRKSTASTCDIQLLDIAEGGTNGMLTITASARNSED